ncbi:hypothetical protein OIU76_004904 [Salix suchowensis]|nr:hypothetical protein OIU76_004904 [Salix suchowensis]
MQGKLLDSYISGKITQLKEQIATLEKREERYKTVFADRISVFRRACCELFGYKIVMDEHQRSNGIPVTRFTLQSVYAQSDDEKLEFEYESGNTNIIANDYTSQPDISRQVDIFIRKMNSIPAFTANLNCIFSTPVIYILVFVLGYGKLQSFDPSDNLGLVVHLMETGEGGGRGAITDASPWQQW